MVERDFLEERKRVRVSGAGYTGDDGERRKTRGRWGKKDDMTRVRQQQGVKQKEKETSSKKENQG